MTAPQHPTARRAARLTAVLVGWRTKAVMLVLTALLATSAPAGEKAAPAGTVFFVDDPATWAEPKKVLPPTYPAAELAQSVTGHVDVRVLISDAGEFKKLISISSTPAVPAFEAAVAEAVQHWQFNMTYGMDCSPIEAEGTNRVWFEIKEGKPVISVSRVEKTLPGSLRHAKTANPRDVAGEVHRFTRRLKGRIGVAVPIYALMTVDAATGQTVDVKVTAVRTSPEVAAVFVEPIRRGLLHSRFETAWPEREGTVQVCRYVTVSFK